MTSYDFPRGLPGESPRFDPFRGPRRALAFPLAPLAEKGDGRPQVAPSLE